MNCVKDVQLPARKQQNSTKHHLHQAIKARDLSLFEALTKLYKVAPNEELTAENTSWTCLHYACHFDACIILDFLLKQVYSIYKDDYAKIINTKTSEGWNPLMVCSMYGSDSCLQLLLKYGGVRLYEKDRDGFKAIDLAKKYRKESTYKILGKQAEQYPPKTIVEPHEFETPLNIEALEAECAITSYSTKLKCSDFEDQDEYRELLRCGQRLPCVVCQGSNGWLKYSKCCGNPIHPLCVKEMKTCVYCGDNKLRITTNLKYPEKAFVLNTID